MTFEEILDQAMAMLQRRGRLTYGTLKRQFQLDDAALEDLKNELIEGQRLAVDERGNVLVWIGAAGPASPAPSPSATTQEHAPLTYTPPYLAEKILTSRSALEGERKQVTVLFADLKGSMELLADRDPEDARQLLDPVLERMMDAVHRYEGTVNQVMGDGIMALFGAPIAHEDHAVRACYAALAMQASVQQYAAEAQRTKGVPIHIRVGLNSGEVVVRSIGSDLHMDYSAVGETTHLAARMEQMAMPGSIVITGETRRQALGYVAVRSLGLVPVKGLPNPVEAFELQGAGPARTRLQAVAMRERTRFVGREAEREVLRQALTQAQRGRGQVVAVVGEPGVGKSRLIHEFTHAPEIQGWLILESHTLSYSQAVPYLPVCNLLKAYFQLQDGDAPHHVRARLTAQLLMLDNALHPTVPSLLALLGVSVEDPAWQVLGPLQRHQRMLDAVKRLLLRESQRQPLLLVVEDLHWVDAETHALLETLVESLPAARLLLLVSGRPEYQPRWGRKTYYTQLRLDPLTPDQAQTLLNALLGGIVGLEPLKQRLVEWSQGNPFFLEESVRALVETQVLVGQPGAYWLDKPLSSLPVPVSVQTMLAARIDRLPPDAKDVLQTAAVVGTDVPFSLLQAIAEVPEERLRRIMTELQAAEFLYEASLFPELAYTFSHALTHEVAYGSLLQARRHALHRRVIEVLEALDADHLAEQVERLADHAVRGEVWEKAFPYCRQAGARAAARSAHQEAVTWFGQALDALRYLPKRREFLEQAIDLQCDLESALVALAGYGTGFDTLGEAERLAEALGDHQRLGRVYGYQARHFRIARRYDRALAAGQRLLTIATDLQDAALRVMAHAALGEAYCGQGDYLRAIDLLSETVASLDGERLHERFGLDWLLLAVTCRAWLVRCLAEVGAFAEGRAIGQEAVRMAEAVDHPLSQIIAYDGAGLLYLRQGHLQQAIAVLEHSLELRQEWGITWGITPYPGFPGDASALGCAYALSERLTESLQQLEQITSKAQGGEGLSAFVVEVCWLTGSRNTALMLARSALEASRTHKERGHEAWAIRFLGEIYRRQDPPATRAAETSYHQALIVAEGRRMRPLQAHCHLGLGTLYAKLGRPDSARTELSAAIEWYRAMDMTFWLPQAEAALAQVEGR
jgi:class 3 adenylate cyclase/tetratricopeptide (TPR) repeat protein